MRSSAIRAQLWALSLLVLAPGWAFAEKAPSGIFENAACVSCHEQREPSLVGAWRMSGHKATDCTACHGGRHGGAAVRARDDAICMTCHGGPKGAVAHSYVTSKHGVINRLEAPAHGWDKPLRDGNYRAPGCAYCHMHRSEHNVSRGIAPPGDSEARARARDVMQPVCYDCHGPRYVAQLWDNGQRMLELGQMKHREARAIVEQGGTMEPVGHTRVEALLENMAEHLNNLRLGVGHQSPDYQWWHGHPALDGDLLRIKGVVTRHNRIRALEAKRPTPAGAPAQGR